FLITHINGEALPVPEWRDTILIPAATRVPPDNNNINEADFGTVTFRTFYDPVVPGSFVFHCHILTHEDVGMMQKLTVFP
ncbi:MAG: multicopper oxidase domain-containing protein, partial [Candidatus Dadabacteria bacterium]|nr:multicopper oxidase domain-containing protein [Candidatus Dadabacteria bacterium]